MNRPIKFRAWDKCDGEMFNVLSINFIEGGGTILTGKGGSISGTDCELMQFTGLHDRDGKEIYEGDVVKSPNGENYEVYYRDVWGSFALYDGRGGTAFFGERYDTKGYVVIGNIFENPELLPPNPSLE